MVESDRLCCPVEHQVLDDAVSRVAEGVAEGEGEGEGLVDVRAEALVNEHA